MQYELHIIGATDSFSVALKRRLLIEGKLDGCCDFKSSKIEIRHLYACDATA